MATIVITKTSNGGTFQRDGGSVYSLFGQPDGLYDFGNKIVFKDQYEDLSFYSTDAVTIDGVSQSGNTAVQIAANLRSLFPDANSSSGGSGDGLFPVNSKIGFFGDSISRNGYTVLDATNQYFATAGFASWAMLYSDHKYFVPVAPEMAVVGDSTTAMVARLGRAVDLELRVVTVLGGANDGFSSAAATIKNLKTIYDAFLGKRTKVIAITILPRFSSFALSGPQEIVRQAINTWILSQASTNISVINAETFVNDSSMFADGLHPNSAGSKALGAPIGAILKSWVSTFGKVSDLTGPDTNYITNGNILTGTGGSVSGGASGSVATSFTLDATSAGGATVVGSKTTSTDNLEQQVITISGTYSGTSRQINLSRVDAITGLGVGDVYEGFVEFEVIGSTQNLSFVNLQAAIRAGSPGFGTPAQGNSMSKGSDGPVDPYLPGRYVMRTPQIPFNAGIAINVQAYLYIQLVDNAGSSPVSAQIKIHKMGMRRVLSAGRRVISDAAATMLATDKTIAYATLTATRAYTLLAASAVPGQRFMIKDEAGTAGTNVITVVGTINGTSNPTVINANYGTYRFYSNGTAYLSE